MIRLSKEEMIKDASKTVGDMYESISSKKSLDIKDIEISKTALIIVDMINGFVRLGALKSERVEGIVNNITLVQKYFKNNSGEIVAFVDTHTKDSKEFDSYPPHCIKATNESEILDEIKALGGYSIIEKNSTNGFLENKFQDFLKSNPYINTFILVGCCTDICVMQLGVTLKNYFNMINKPSRIIVPIDSVETYSLGEHNGDFIDLISIKLMEFSGIEIVKEIVI